MKHEKQVLDLIAKNCRLRRIYATPDPSAGECVIGALALAAGVKRSVLLDAGTMAVSSEYKQVVPIRKAIWGRFKLNSLELEKLQKINDSHEDIKSRRAALKRAVEKFG